MQQKDSNPPTPPNIRADSASHRLRALCTLLKQRADVKVSGLRRTGIGAEVAKLPQAEHRTMMDYVDGVAAGAENMRDANSETECTELRVCMLLAQAEISESDFKRLGTIEPVETEIECRRQVLSLTPETHAGRSYHLGKLGISLNSRFECLGEPTDLNQAIEYLSEAMRLSGDSGLYTIPIRSCLGTAYQCRFRRLGELSDLEEAIAHQAQAVLLTPNGHESMPSRLGRLGNSQGIENLNQAVSLCPDGDEDKTDLLENLGISRNCRFERLGELGDMDAAIKHQTQSVLLTPNAHTARPSRLDSLGNSYQSRFGRLGELDDVEKAIEYQTQAVMLTPDGHAAKPARLNNLGIAHQRRFGHLGELVDLDKAIEYKIHAVLLTPDGHPLKPSLINNLGNAYRARFMRLGELADIDKALEFQNQAMRLTPDGLAVKIVLLSNLGDSQLCRFRHLGELIDVDKAIEYHSQAVLLTPDGHADKPARLKSLGNAYQGRFWHIGALADLDKAIEYKIQAVRLTPDGHALKPSLIANLGGSYMSRFQRLGELEDINKAIEYQNEAMRLTADGQVAKIVLLSELGVSHLSRFRHIGELIDVDKAIESHTQALLLTPDDHTAKPDCLTSLGDSYLCRFERLGELPDVDKAIEYHAQAALLTPDEHPEKPSRLSRLGHSHHRRFGRRGELGDLDKAIQSHTQALLCSRDGHTLKPGLLNNLGISYISRFQLLGELADIDKAIEYGTKAVLLTPDGDAHKPCLLNDLGLSHMHRFESLSELTDMHKAISYQTQAVQLTPNGHTEKPSHLRNLGNSYLTRLARTNAPADLMHARLLYQFAAQHIITDPECQITRGHAWAKASFHLGQSPLPAYQRCMELLPHTVWLGCTINQRYHLLTTISEFATDAAAWAISEQEYDLALEWLEQGRSVVWNQILHLRTPFDDLAAVDPSLAQRLKDVAGRLEGAGTRPPITFSSHMHNTELEKAAQAHHRLAEKWEDLLQEARCLPGFQHFMRPRRAEELKPVATDGPVVLVNTHTTRCDALIIFPECDSVTHVPLVNLPKNADGEFDVPQYSEFLARHQGDRACGLGRHVKKGLTYATSENLSKTALSTLWTGVVKPVLDAIACTSKAPVDELPHVTWCATGGLAFAPLHAAGLYDGISPSAFDLVVSSYTPTLSVLLASSVSVSESAVGVLAVGQEYTRGLAPLPSTVPELAAIQRHAQAIRFLGLEGMDATINSVLGAMDEYSWVHLACHATQDSINPANSAFHLSDGNLTLEAITKRQFNNKGLAFLSACQTAKGDGKLPDESVHLAAGMLMAGYPSVIATMWSIVDDDGPEVAERVYAELLEDGKIYHRGAARALHRAIAALRGKIGEGEFGRWVPFIHVGM